MTDRPILLDTCAALWLAAGELKANHPIHEVIGTAGGTFSVVPLTKRVGPGRSMRVRLLNQSDDNIEVASAVLTAWVWEG